MKAWLSLPYYGRYVSSSPTRPRGHCFDQMLLYRLYLNFEHLPCPIVETGRLAVIF